MPHMLPFDGRNVRAGLFEFCLRKKTLCLQRGWFLRHALYAFALTHNNGTASYTTPHSVMSLIVVSSPLSPHVFVTVAVALHAYLHFVLSPSPSQGVLGQAEPTPAPPAAVQHELPRRDRENNHQRGGVSDSAVGGRGIPVGGGWHSSICNHAQGETESESTMSHASI